MFQNRKQVFSIRKTTLGVGSVLLGMLLLAPTVSADQLLNNEENSIETRVSPDTVANLSDGTPADSVQTPKDLVEVTPILAKTEYVPSEDLEAGEIKVVVEAVDGQVEKTTSFKEVEKPVEMVDPISKERMQSTDYKYGLKDFYHVDSTKEKPSDRIVVTKIYSDFKPMTEDEVKSNNTIMDSMTGVSYIDSKADGKEVEQPALLKLTSVAGDKPDIYLAPESINLNDLAFQALLLEYQFIGSTSYNRGTWTGALTEELRKAVQYELLKKTTSRIANLAGFFYLNDFVQDDGKEATAVKAYYTSQLPLNDATFALAKADYARYKELSTQLQIPNLIGGGAIGYTDGGDVMSFWMYNPILNDVESAFETISHRYNTQNDFYESPVTIGNKSLTEKERNLISEEFEEEVTLTPEERQDFLSAIDQLPETIKSNILKLTVTSYPLMAHMYDARGMVMSSSNAITLRYFSDKKALVYTENGKKEIKFSNRHPYDLVDNLMHEVMHAVDNRSAHTHYNTNQYREGSFQTLSTHGRLSYSDEFRKVFEEFYLNREDVWEYIRWTPSEAWADSLGEYIHHKVYGVPYTRYKKIDGVVYEYKPSLAGLNAEYDAMKEMVYDQGYSPVEASESYWEAIYKKLFEPEVQKEIVVDTVSTKTTPAINGLVQIGVKPVVVTETIAFKILEEVDETMPVGYKGIKREGQNGTVRITTSFKLDKQTGQITETTSREVLQEVVDQILVVGTKKVPTDKKVTVVEEVTVIPFETVTIQDPRKPLGFKQQQQKGQDGKLLIRKTTITDPVTGEVSTTTETIVLQEMRKEILILGTKEKNQIAIPVKKPVTIPVSYKRVSSGIEVISSERNDQLLNEVPINNNEKQLPNTGGAENQFAGILGASSMMVSLSLVKSRRRKKS